MLGVGLFVVRSWLESIRYVTGERSGADRLTGIRHEAFVALLLGDIGDRRIDRQGREQKNLCLMRCRAIDDRGGDDAELDRGNLGQAVTDGEVKPVLRLRAEGHRWCGDGRGEHRR